MFVVPNQRVRDPKLTVLTGGGGGGHMLAFLDCGVDVVLTWDAAACTGTCMYLFSSTRGKFATHTLWLRWRSRMLALGRQNSDSRLPMLDNEVMDAIDASDELRLRGDLVSYWTQGMPPFWFAALLDMMSVRCDRL